MKWLFGNFGYKLLAAGVALFVYRFSFIEEQAEKRESDAKEAASRKFGNKPAELGEQRQPVKRKPASASGLPGIEVTRPCRSISTVE